MKSLLMALLLALAVSGCAKKQGSPGQSGANGVDGQNGLDGTVAGISVEPIPASSEQCPAGGTIFQSYQDLNANGSLDDGEVVTSVQVICNGQKGEHGDKGDQGEKGDHGDKGDKGDQGNQGANGNQGDKGDRGNDGSNGQNGQKGDKGDKGDQGNHGDKGDQGSNGTKGDKGDKGDQGNSTYTLSDRASQVQCAVSGVVYTTFVDSNHNGQLDEGETTISAEVLCDGQNGHDGERGDQGLQGNQGDRGDQGNQGVRGDKGDQGNNGLNGANGNQGDKGDKGDQGNNGSNGSQGIQGVKGDKGDQGASGVSQVIKPCSNRNARINRLPNGSLITSTPGDGMTVLDWAVSGVNAPSYSIGGSQSCNVYVDYAGNVCIINPVKGLCASPL